MTNLANRIKINGIWQLTICCLLLFIFPVFEDEIASVLTFWGLILLLFVSASMLSKYQKTYFLIALALTVLQFIARYLDLKVLEIIIPIGMVGFFTWISILLIKHLMRKEAGLQIIIEAIAAYLLLGIALTLIMEFIIYFFPASFNLHGLPMVHNKNYFAINSYFVFITYTTVGYGDIIPLNDIGRSFAKLTAITGQIYISVIIAILIGKNFQTKA